MLRHVVDEKAVDTRLGCHVKKQGDQSPRKVPVTPERAGSFSAGLYLRFCRLVHADLRQPDPGEEKSHQQHDNPDDGIRSRDASAFPVFRKQKQTAYQRSADPSQSVERLSQVDAAFCRLRFSQYGHIRIGGSFQTSQSAADNKEREQEELKTHDPFSRNEEQGTDAVQQQSCKHSCPVAVAPDNVSGRQGHQEIPSVHHRLNQGRARAGNFQCILKMFVQHIQNAVCHSPQKKEGSNQNKRNQETLSVPGSY